MVRSHVKQLNATVEEAVLRPRRRPGRVAAKLVGPEAILDALVEWTRRYGDVPTMADWDPHRAGSLGQEWRIARYHEGDWPSALTVANHFGSFTNAVTCGPRAFGSLSSAEGAPPRLAANESNLASPRRTISDRSPLGAGKEPIPIAEAEARYVISTLSRRVVGRHTAPRRHMRSVDTTPARSQTGGGHVRRREQRIREEARRRAP